MGGRTAAGAVVQTPATRRAELQWHHHGRRHGFSRGPWRGRLAPGIRAARTCADSGRCPLARQHAELGGIVQWSSAAGRDFSSGAEPWVSSCLRRRRLRRDRPRPPGSATGGLVASADAHAVGVAVAVLLLQRAGTVGERRCWPRKCRLTSPAASSSSHVLTTHYALLAGMRPHRGIASAGAPGVARVWRKHGPLQGTGFRHQPLHPVSVAEVLAERFRLGCRRGGRGTAVPAPGPGRWSACPCCGSS